MAFLTTMILVAVIAAAVPTKINRWAAEAIRLSIATPLQNSKQIAPEDFERAQQLAPAMLRSRDSAVRLIGARLLRHVGNSTHVRQLIGALKDKDDNVGAAAADALGAIGDYKSVPALEAAVAMDATHTKPASIRALVAINGPDAQRALERLLRRLKNANDQSEIRKALARMNGRQ